MVRQVARYESLTLGGIEVFFTAELDGGGGRYGQDYVPFVTEHFGPRRRVFEWCAGPGFIGFSLLGHGLAETLCLADVNPAAMAACRETVERNGLQDVVALYVSDGLDQIPAGERWDLVVGNPPHSGTGELQAHIQRPPLIYQDVDWRLHERFYAGIGKHLTGDADVVIQENLRFSSPDTFRPMLERGGLELVASPLCRTPPGNALYYYVWSVPRGGAAA